MKNFEGKVAVITGAASGLGRELAGVAASLGMKLVLADVEHEALARVKNDLEEQGAHVMSVPCDVSKLEDVRALADTTVDRYGAVHLLFNNAGVGTGGLVWENSIADWQWVLGVNMWGVIHGIHVFTPLMLECAKKEENFEGHIVNTSSIAGLLNSPLLGIYNASKHAIVSLSEDLYQDLKLINAPVGCTVLCPFFMKTGISQSQRNRPEELKSDMTPTISQQVSAALVDRAVNAGTSSPQQVAIAAFEAIRNEQFYVFSDLNVLRDVQTRMDDILQQRNPSDPYANLPQVRKFVELGLKRTK